MALSLEKKISEALGARGVKDWELTLSEFCDLVYPLATATRAEQGALWDSLKASGRLSEYDGHEAQMANWAISAVDSVRSGHKRDFSSMGGVNNPVLNHGQHVFMALRQGKDIPQKVLDCYECGVAEVRKSMEDERRVEEEYIQRHVATRANPERNTIAWALNEACIPERPDLWECGEICSQYRFTIPDADGSRVFLVSDSRRDKVFLCAYAGDGCVESDERKADQLARKWGAWVHFNMYDEMLWIAWSEPNMSGFLKYVANEKAICAVKETASPAP